MIVSRTTVWRCAALLLLVVIGVLTLTPANQTPSTSPWYCLFCDDQAVTDAILNVVMFVPVGLSLRRSGLRERSALLLCFLYSTAIEVLQGTVITGRDPSLRDVLTNTLGAAIGIAMASRLRLLLAPPTRRAGLAMTGTAAAAFIAMTSVSGVAVRPCAPPLPYDGRWLPNIPGDDPFDGRLIAASLYGAPWPNGPTTEGPQLRDRLRTGRITARVVLEPDPASAESSTLLTLNGFQSGAISVSQEGRRVVVKLPQCAVRLRLRLPEYVLPRAFGAPPQDSSVRAPVFTFSLTTTRDRVNLMTLGAGQTRHVELRLTPFLGWALLRPFYWTVFNPTPILSLLWLAIWIAPLGYWAGWTAHADRAHRVARERFPAQLLAWGMVLVALSGSLFVIPRALGIAPANLIEWTSSLMALFLGAVVGWLSARHRGRDMTTLRVGNR